MVLVVVAAVEDMITLPATAAVVLVSVLYLLSVACEIGAYSAIVHRKRLV